MASISRAISRTIADAVKAYEAKRHDFIADAENLKNRLFAHSELRQMIHSIKWRAKEPSHLKDSLERKARRAISGSGQFDITAENVFDTVPDLAGV